MGPRTRARQIFGGAAVHRRTGGAARFAGDAAPTAGREWTGEAPRLGGQAAHLPVAREKPAPIFWVRPRILGRATPVISGRRSRPYCGGRSPPL